MLARKGNLAWLLAKSTLKVMQCIVHLQSGQIKCKLPSFCDLFSECFHWQTHQQICNKEVIKDPTTPQTYEILSAFQYQYSQGSVAMRLWCSGFFKNQVVPVKAYSSGWYEVKLWSSEIWWLTFFVPPSIYFEHKCNEAPNRIWQLFEFDLRICLFQQIK